MTTVNSGLKKLKILKNIEKIEKNLKLCHLHFLNMQCFIMAMPHKILILYVILPN